MKFFQHFALIFKLYEMKLIINHNQISTQRSIQNTVNKYSWIL